MTLGPVVLYKVPDVTSVDLRQAILRLQGDVQGRISKNPCRAITFDLRIYAQPNSHTANLAKYLDIWLSAMNMAKWGIPEKSI